MPKPTVFQIESCQYIRVSSLVPDNWVEWFYQAISESKPPFHWGMNNRSMVDVVTFINHCQDTLTDNKNVSACILKSWIAKLDRIPKNVYIDMEN